jgi:serine/threonine protein kinase
VPISIGQVLNNRYRIVKLLGKGGFGAVYKAWDLRLDKHWALKENLETTPEAERQFTREATILANLSHPNLPRVTDHFLVPGQGQYLVMDFIEGQDLESVLQHQRTVPTDQAIGWITQIADALIYLHSQQPPVIHRDLKPANIRITPAGQAMLVDFGLVKVYDPHLRTTVGARAVTPGYSPPEQYGQGNTDICTDIYALGATLYTLLTGQEPPESVQRVVDDQLILASTVNPQIPVNIGQAIAKAMSLRPSQRYQLVSQFKQALTAPKPPSPPPIPRAVAPAPIPRAVAPVYHPPAAPAPAPFVVKQPPQSPSRPFWPILLGLGVIVTIIVAVVASRPKPTPAVPPASGSTGSSVQSTQTARAWNDLATQTAYARSRQATQTSDTWNTQATTEALHATQTAMAYTTPVSPPPVRPTPFPILGYPCQGAPGTRVEVGNMVIVTTTEGDTLTLRTSPQVGNNAKDKIKPGVKLRIVSGPQCFSSSAYHFTYWEVTMLETSERGWVSEGDSTTYWLEPVY